MPPKPKPAVSKALLRIPSDDISISAIVPELKPHFSAPSYLHSLADNDRPPFKKPVKEPRPKLLSAPFPLVNEEDVVGVIAQSEEDPVNGLTKALTILLIDKKVIRNYDLTERDFLISLLIETISYAAQRDFSAHKLSTQITIYLNVHLYFKWYYWSTPDPIWNYFHEVMLRHTVQDSPDADCVFDSYECYDILTHFHTMYISNLPLIHILTFGAHRLKLNWPFKNK